jgi:hypothetical protein
MEALKPWLKFCQGNTITKIALLGNGTHHRLTTTKFPRF